VEYIVGQVEAVPLAAHSFDAILLLDVLEHLDDDYLGLREAAGLVKPGGLLLVTVPAGPSLWGGQDVVSHHRRRYTRRALLETFRRAALPRPRLNYFNTLLFPPIAVTRWVRGAIGLAHRSRSDFDDSHPGLMNDILGKVFALERYLIGRVPLPVGVSLIATLRLNAG
jgi:SAM-dependent methyltransferase